MAGCPVDADVSGVAAEGGYLVEYFVSKWVGGGRVFDGLEGFEGIGKDTNLRWDGCREIIHQKVECVDYGVQFTFERSSMGYAECVRPMNSWQVRGGPCRAND